MFSNLPLGAALPSPARIILAAIERHARGDPEALARAILAELDKAGLEIRPKPDVIPIKGNPTCR